MPYSIRKCTIDVMVRSREDDDSRDSRIRTIDLTANVEGEDGQPGLRLTPSEAAALGGILISAAGAARNMTPECMYLHGEVEAFQEFDNEPDTD